MLREKLAKETRGRITLELGEGATIAEALTALQIKPPVLCVLNGANERDISRQLNEGDELQFFHAIGGGGMQTISLQHQPGETHD
jgi:sulfur carrier protein ThiS